MPTDATDNQRASSDASSAGRTPTSPTPSDGRTARRLVSKQRIEEAAMQLFATRGYSGATLDDTAEVAGVTKGTIFNNYKNKSELFEQLLRAAAQDLSEQMRESRHGVSGWDALDRATLRVAELVDEAPAPSLLIGAELFRQGQPWEKAVIEARAMLLAPIVEILAEIGAERAARGNYFVPAEQRPNVAVAILGALVSSTLDRATYSPDRPLTATHAVLISALRSETSAPASPPQARA